MLTEARKEMSLEMIRKKDAILHVDITCCTCGKLWAMSYCNPISDGRYQCQKCSPSLEEAIESLIKDKSK